MSEKLFPTDIVLLVCVATLPVLLVDNWGNSFTEPKLALLFALSALCSFALLRQLRWKKPSVNLLTAGLFILVLFDIKSVFEFHNVGLQLQAIGLRISALVIALYISNSRLSIFLLSKVVIVPTLVLLVGALAMIFYRTALFSNYAPFGSAIGLKNSLSVFLAQLIPLLLILTYYYRKKSKLSAKLIWGITFILLTIVFLVIFSSRTRSAWVMISFYLISLCVLSIKSKSSIWRSVLSCFCFTSILGIIALISIPNELIWKSNTPYTDSLQTLTSLEYSSGRDQLWTVGLQMFKLHPWGGVGVGNYSVLWRKNIEAAGVDPKSFAFIRPDLPLFNDYLQNAVESGIFSMLLFCFVILGLPTLYLSSLWRKGANDNVAEILLCIMCLGTAVDAFFDYPFNRPETLFLYIIALSLVSRKVGFSTKFQVNSLKVWIVALLIPALCLSALFVQMSIGLTARKYWNHSTDVRYLRTALKFWPWDCQWDHKHAIAFIKSNDLESAKLLSQLRLQAWPDDPESYLIKAKVFESQKQFSKAIDSYRLAVVKVKNGRCYRPGWKNYNNLIKQYSFPSSIKRLTPSEISACYTKN